MSCDARATTVEERIALAPRPRRAGLGGTALATLAGVLGGACGLEPRPIEHGYALQASTRASLAERPDARDAIAKLASGLEQRFGTPEAPHGALAPRASTD